MQLQADHRSDTPSGRLVGKVAIVTGAAGNIGREICLRLLREGASLALLGRNSETLEALRHNLSAQVGSDLAGALPVVCDAAEPSQTRAAAERVFEHFGRIDVLVNNAGSAGPRQRLEDVPIARPDVGVRDASVKGEETALEAAHNIFGVSWNMVRAVAPFLQPGASVVNVSTIFSRTPYFGRTAYVVPKAALNTWSKRLARELGRNGIRVNTVFPGPIASERITSVFASMDALRRVDGGTTASEVIEMMTLSRAASDASVERTFPTIADVANAIVFLGSDESAAINGHNFDITHGMLVPQESRSTLISRPGLRIVDAAGRSVLIAAGDQVRDALEVARVHAERGAAVVIGLGSQAAVSAARALLQPSGDDVRIAVDLFDRRDSATMAALLRSRDLAGAVILPAFGAPRFRNALATAGDDDVRAFIDDELLGSIGVARELTRHWKAQKTSSPGHRRVIFVSNGDDGRGNVYADMLCAAQEQLARVWRDETSRDAATGQRERGEWITQIVRWTNREEENLNFAAAWSAKLIHGKRRVDSLNLYLPESLEGDTGARRATFGDSESLIGLHLGKVALITGGSAGIGAQIGRLLALAGARVVLAARDREKLEATRDNIVRDLEAIGYDDATERVSIVADIEVAEEACLQRCVKAAIERFGRVDYLVNNAGISGAEQMVIDMPLDAWRRTLRANLVSNFSLMARLIPEMKRRGAGYVVNVSSYFGGEKYVAVAYPNRADYAVSKAGQRALVETLAAFVGPGIQLNAIAPGPVDGVRLRGAGGPGLFERRGRVILENQRLNALYGVAIEMLRSGDSVASFIEAAMQNDVRELLRNASTSRLLRLFCERIAAAKPAQATCSSYDWLMNARMATKLIERLARGGYLQSAAGVRLASEPPEPFIEPRDIQRQAEKVRADVLKLLHLHKMPTETEVALATVYFLADRAISGETFHPSGGLKQERSVTERELFGRSKEERVERMHGRTVWIVGDHPPAQIARAVQTYVTECQVARVVLLSRNASTATHVRKRLSTEHSVKLSAVTIGMDIEEGLQRALVQFERPAAVLSMPMGLLPTTIFDEPRAMMGNDFETLLEEQVTNHFRVARFASLLEDVRIILVSPEVPLGGSVTEFALASCIKTTLHALTATAAVENERLVHEVPVNQINLTRQAQSDEPRNLAEYDEKMERFARAIVLESGPLPNAGESRYRAKIYRGVAITV